METSEGRGEAFVVAGEAAEASRPAEGSFDEPASGQEDEAAPGQGEFDDLELEPVGGSRLGRHRAGVALIDVGQLDVFAGRRLDLLHRRR